jgi:hypothetical protein
MRTSAVLAIPARAASIARTTGVWAVRVFILWTGELACMCLFVRTKYLFVIIYATSIALLKAIKSSKWAG